RMSPGAFNADVQRVAVLHFDDRYLDQHLRSRLIEIFHGASNSLDGLLVSDDHEITRIVDRHCRLAHLAVGSVLRLAGTVGSATATTTTAATTKSAQAATAQAAAAKATEAARAAINIQHGAQAEGYTEVFFQM